MTDEGARMIAMALAVGLGAIGPGAGIGIIFNGALQAMGRNPEAEGTLRTYMFLGFALAEQVEVGAVQEQYLHRRRLPQKPGGVARAVEPSRHHTPRKAPLPAPRARGGGGCRPLRRARARRG